MDWVPRSVNILEVVWFLTGAIPLARGLRFLRELRRVQRRIREEQQGEAEEITIATHLGSNAIIAFGHAVIAGIGVAAMALPPANPGGAARDVSPVGLVLTVGLFLLSLTFWAKSQWNQNRWGVITRYVADHAEEIRTLRGVGETVARLEAQLAENTRLTQHAAEQATAAFEEANSTNLKIERAIELGNTQIEALGEGKKPPHEGGR